MIDTSWSGDLGKIALPEVMSELHRERATGALFCVRAGLAREILWERGALLWARSSHTDDTLGKWLFRRGRLGLQAIGANADAAIEKLDPAEIDESRRVHALELLLDIFAWREGAFAFQPLAAVVSPLKLELPFSELLGRGIRRIERIEPVFTGAGMLDARIDVAASDSYSASAEAAALLTSIRSREPLSAPLPDFRLLQCLWELRLLRLIVPAPGDSGIALSGLIGQRTATSSLKTAPAAPVAPLPRATAIVSPAPAALAPPKPTPPAPAPAAVPVAATAPAAAAVTTVQPLPTSGKPVADAPARGADAALEWFKSGDRYARELDFHNAVTSYREAVQLAPGNAEYHFRLGTVLGRNPKWRKEAEESFLQAIELQAWETRFHVALGRLYAQAGLTRRAEARFRSALAQEPDNAAARRELKLLQTQIAEGDRKRSPRAIAAGIADKTPAADLAEVEEGEEQLTR